MLDSATSPRVQEELWALVQLKPGGPSRALANLNRHGFETFLPLQKVTSRRGGRFVQGTRSLFPGYLFVNVAHQPAAWRSVNSTYGVTRIVTFDMRSPALVPNALVESLKASTGDDGVLKATAAFKEGETVKVIDGPFANKLGQILSARERDRIYILLDLMGQKIRTEIREGDLERA